MRSFQFPSFAKCNGHLELRPQSGSSQVRLEKELFQAVEDLGRIVPSPFNSGQVSARFDVPLGQKNRVFPRYSQDGNEALAPVGTATLPSNWRRNSNWADQSIAGLTTVFGPVLLNGLRFSYSYWKPDCDAPFCS